MIWGSEVEARTDFVFDSGVGVELGAVIGGDGFDRGPLALDERNDLPIELIGGTRAQLSDDDVFGLTLNQGDDAVPVMGAHDGVRLPMAEAGSVVGAKRALGDVALIGQDSPGIGASVAFPALLRGLAQESVKAPAVAAVVPDVTIDGLVTDIENTLEAQPAGDLLRAPVQAQQGNDHLQMPVGEAPIAPGMGASGASAPFGLAGSVGAVVTLIAVQLPGDRAAVASNLVGDGGQGESLHAQSGDHIPLSGGDLAVVHRSRPLLAG